MHVCLVTLMVTACFCNAREFSNFDGYCLLQLDAREFSNFVGYCLLVFVHVLLVTLMVTACYSLCTCL
jgi:hypothetical protein